jgi:hypothetical protein
MLRQMNERIRELTDKIWAEEYWDKPTTDKLLPAQLNKFAELIVRECIDIAYEYDAPKLSGPGMIIGNRIQEHFGVTE